MVITSEPINALTLRVIVAALEHPFELVICTPIISLCSKVLVTNEVKRKFPDTASEDTGIPSM